MLSGVREHAGRAAMSVDVHAHFWTDAYLDKIAALGKADTAA